MDSQVIMTPVSAQVVDKVVTKSPVVIDEVKGVYRGTYQKEGTNSLQLRQAVTTVAKYPSKRATSSLNKSLASEAEFGFENTQYSNIENRVAWINIPLAWTIEQAKAKLAAMGTNAVLYKFLDNRPILDEHQQYAVNNGLTTKTLNDYANDQVVRYGAEHENLNLRGKIVKDPHGKVQYRRILFSDTPLEDQDNRVLNPDYGYVSPEIQAELDGIPTNVSVVPTQGLEG